MGPGSNTSMGGDHMLEQKQDPQPDQNHRVALLTKNDDSLKSTGFLVSSLHGRVGQVGTQQSDLAGQSDFNQTTVGRLVNEESDWSEECPVGTKPHPYGVWKGTAPFCDAHPSDCTNNGYEYVKSDSHGDGSTCWSGNKVYCQKMTCRPDDSYNPLCNAQLFRISVRGTAPYCAASECDCLQMGEVPYSSQAEVENPCVDIARFNSAGGETTKPCWTGTHVLCLKPVADLINGPAGNLARELNRNIEMQKTMCINGQKFSHEENMGMMKLPVQPHTIPPAVENLFNLGRYGFSSASRTIEEM